MARVQRDRNRGPGSISGAMRRTTSVVPRRPDRQGGVGFALVIPPGARRRLFESARGVTNQTNVG
jgi:hypothetical protein